MDEKKVKEVKPVASARDYGVGVPEYALTREQYWKFRGGRPPAKNKERK